MIGSVTVALVNQSKRVSDADLQTIAAACNTQLTRDVAPIWGPVPTVVFFRKGTKVPGDALVATVSDTSDQPGAAGYHTETPKGAAYIKIFTFAGAPILQGSEALSVTISHELCELVVDMPANKWADGPDGSDYAYEACDAVEGDTYEIDGVYVSNFLFPAFFDPQVKKGTRLAYLKTVTEPFKMTAGGYQIVRTEPGTEKQVFAKGHELIGLGIGVVFGPKFPEHKKAAKIAKAIRRRASRKVRKVSKR